MEYRTCVSDTEEVLKGLSEIIDITYIEGKFSQFEYQFSESGKDEDFYVLRSKDIKVSVHLEKYEGYFYISISGNNSVFSNAKKYLLQCA